MTFSSRWRLWAFSAISLSAFVAIAAACSSSDAGAPATKAPDGSASSSSSSSSTGGPTTDGPAPVTADVACAQYAAARCSKLDACANGVGSSTRYGDNATCLSRVAAQCVTGLSAPGTGATPATTSACAAAITNERCDGFFAVLDTPEECAAQPGQGALGAPCATSSQCASAFCALGSNAACGVCAATPTAGNPCGKTSGCGRGLTCNAATGTCIVPSVAGAACSADATCDALLRCVKPVSDAGADAGDAGLTLGTCTADSLDAGASCAATDPRCSPTTGLYCEPGVKTCAVLGLAQANQLCGALDGGVDVTCAGGKCVLADGAKAGTCAAATADNAACSTEGANTCLPPARCVDNGTDSGAGTCTLLNASMCH